MTWRLDEEDMEFIFKLRPEMMDRILESFKKTLTQHMEKSGHLYKEKEWWVIQPFP